MNYSTVNKLHNICNCLKVFPFKIGFPKCIWNLCLNVNWVTIKATGHVSSQCPLDTCSLDNCPLDNSPPPPENRHLGQSPLDNCHPGQLPPPLHPLTEQLPPRTITPWAITLDNSCLELLYYPPDIYTRTITAKSDGNYKLQFFHGCFLFLFHGPII